MDFRRIFWNLQNEIKKFVKDEKSVARLEISENDLEVPEEGLVKFSLKSENVFRDSILSI